MSLKKLKRLAKLKHISEFSAETIITDFGLYESAVIDLRAVPLVEEDEPRIEVNPDVKMLQQFLLSKTPLLLPCPECEKEMAFNPRGWGNPRNLENTVPIKEEKKKPSMVRIATNLNGYDGFHHQNVFEVTEPHFMIGNPVLVSLNSKDMEFIKQEEVKRQLLDNCILKCKDYFLKFAPEIRRDFYCTLDSFHKVFVNFRIYDPVDPEDIEEYGKMLIEGENDYTRAYEYLCDCLIIQKVGQYPSLADLQMFDVEKYRSVLGKDSYRDLTRALGLNADGIGCGAFLYLRRILERLVEEAHQVEMLKEDWDEQIYKESRFNERIQILENAGNVIIPELLKELKSKIYGALSKGVHESTDDECMELFPYMQFVIEQILDERIRKRELEQNVAKLRIKLNNRKE